MDISHSTYKIPWHSGKNAALCIGTKPVQLVNNEIDTNLGPKTVALKQLNVKSRYAKL